MDQLADSHVSNILLSKKEFLRLPDWCALTKDVNVILSTTFADPNTKNEACIEVACEVEFSALCQRCLDEMVLTVAVKLIGERKSGDTKNYYFSSEEISGHADRYCKNGQLDILRLCEDEILLCLPMAPKHANKCSTGQFDNPRVTNTANPFSLLAKGEDKN